MMRKTLQEFISERQTEEVELSILLEEGGQPDSGGSDGRPNAYERDDLACKFGIESGD